jgi:hypothetical protein
MGLLLPQQRRHRRPGLPRPGSQSRDPRCRLPPRQRHPVDFLRAQRRAVHLDPRPPGSRVPFFLGYEDERRRRRRGLQLQLPLPAGSGWDTWSAALEQACNEIESYGADIIVVSLGVDTFKDDPISQFKLDSPDYLAMGKRIAASASRRCS